MACTACSDEIKQANRRRLRDFAAVPADTFADKITYAGTACNVETIDRASFGTVPVKISKQNSFVIAGWATIHQQAPRRDF